MVLSSLSSCPSQEIAQRVSQDLGYEYLGPEIEAEAASMAGVRPERVQQALSHKVWPLVLRSRAREKHLAYFQAALVSALARGNVLYSGELGHLLAPRVSHILKVNLTASLEDRALYLAGRESIPVARARDLIVKDDAQREKWRRRIFETNGSESSLFDLVVDVSEHGVDGVRGIITDTAREVRFQPVTYSLKSLRDYELACRIRASLIEEFGPLEVVSRDGEVTIRSRALSRSKKADTVRGTLLDMEGVNFVVFE
jgi:cytidylate kinase